MDVSYKRLWKLLIDTRGKIEKMSEPVQVYTACRFVSVSEYALYFPNYTYYT